MERAATTNNCQISKQKKRRYGSDRSHQNGSESPFDRRRGEVRLVCAVETGRKHVVGMLGAQEGRLSPPDFKWLMDSLRLVVLSSIIRY